MSVNAACLNTRILTGGGEMGELIRQKDWSKTPVGKPESWPQTLRTTLNIILHSKFPMFLWWGPKLICFYNDAYRPSLGQNGKHPSILGQEAAEAWPEIWDIIQPLIDQVLAGGEATWSEDQLIPIYRNGIIEDVYWTFCYSPVNDESDNVAGVLVTCSETTNKVNTFKSLEESNRRYLNNIIQAPVAMCIFRGKEHIVEIANERMLELWGITAAQVVNRPIFEGLPEAAGQGLEQLLENVYNTGEKYVANERAINLPRNGKIETTFINFLCEALKEPDGTISGIVAIASEVTLQVIARKKVEESEERFRTMAEGTEVLIAVGDETSNATYFNKAWVDLTGRPMEDLLKFGWTDLVHPDDREGYVNIYLSAFEKRKPFTGEFRILNKKGQYRWLLAKGPPLFRLDGSFAGYISSSIDITERRQNEEDKQKLAAIIEASHEFISLAGVDTSAQYVNPAGLRMLGWDYFEGRQIIDCVFPEDREFAKEILPQLMEKGSFQHEIRFWNERSGEPFWLQWNGITINDPVSGKIVNLATVSPNITEHKHAVEALKESEQRFRNLVMRSPIPMTIFRGKDFIIEIANARMVKDIWRKKETDILGKKALDVFPELKQQKYPELLHEVYTTGKTHTEIESIAYVQGDDGLKKFYLDFEYTPLIETDGNISGIIITVNDVTVKVEARKKVEEAEERLRLATEATELATWELDLQTREIIHSFRLAEILGHDNTRKLSHPEIRSQVHHDDIHEIVEKSFDLAMVTGIYNCEFRFLRPDDEIRWIRIQGKVFCDEKSNPVKIVGTLRDITEEKQHQQELEESEQKFRLLADSMPQHIWTSDIEGNLNYFNLSVFNYSGLTPEQINKEGWIKIVHPDDREKNISMWKNAVSTGEDFLIEHRFRRYDGEYRWQLSRAIPQKDADGKIQMWVGTSTDIQDQKTFAGELEILVQERTSELEQKNKELQTMNTELQSFAYVSSHDLQEPLRKIQTFATRILEKEQQNLSDYGKDYFRRMQDAAKRMQILIEDLLAYSRTGTMERTFENTDLNQILDEVKNELKEDIQQKHAVIEANQLCRADIIPFQFRQVVHNLIGNALKFSKPENPPRIKIKSEIVEGYKTNIPALSPQKNYCHFSISDNGIGFDPKYEGRIFEVFQRLHGHDEYKGTGIGLAIVKKIVENHNGIITAKGQLDKGATFDIYLPAP